MLKPDGQPERARHGRRWALLLLVPPTVLLVWVLVGMDVQVGNRRLQTYWKHLPREEPVIDQGSIPTALPRLAYPKDRDRYRWVGSAWVLKIAEWHYFVRLGKRVLMPLRQPRRPQHDEGYPGALPVYNRR
jgi:hypothetical protein